MYTIYVRHGRKCDKRGQWLRYIGAARQTDNLNMGLLLTGTAVGERVFGEKEWNKLVAGTGDFTVLGIHLKTNAVQGVINYISASQDT